MKIKKVIRVGKHKVYDISVKDAEHYILKNGVVTHNTGIILSANTALIMSRKKGDKDEQGFEFIIKTEKSRFIKEGLKFPLVIPDGGQIKKYSGLFDLALETGFLEKSGMRYKIPEIPDFDLVWRKDVEDNDDFWNTMFTKTTFVKTIEDSIKVSVDQSEVFNKIKNIDTLEYEEELKPELLNE